MTTRKPKPAISPLIETQPTEQLQLMPVSADRKTPARGYQNWPAQIELPVSRSLPNRGKTTIH
jgi:hypothetical protein